MQALPPPPRAAAPALDEGQPAGPQSVTALPARLALLSELRDRQVPLLVSAPGGATLQSLVWSVDEPTGRMSLAARHDSLHLDALVDTDEAVAVAYLDSARLQFDLHDLVLVRAEQQLALQCRLPVQLLRFQRRGAYRVSTTRRPSAEVSLRHPALPDMQLSLRLLDVSLGGCALWLPEDVPALQPGTRLAGARVQLDRDTGFHADLVLQHVSAIGPADNETPLAAGARLGCAWQLQTAAAERLLQRWIDQAQKRQRLLGGPASAAPFREHAPLPRTAGPAPA